MKSPAHGTAPAHRKDTPTALAPWQVAQQLTARQALAASASRRQRQPVRQAVERASRFLADLPPRWIGKRILVIGHLATRWALDQALGAQSLDTLIDTDFDWQEGWEYTLTTA